MGADLTGYIVIGPKAISKDAIEKAALKLFEYKTQGGINCPNCGEHIDMEACEEPCDQCGNFITINPFRLDSMQETIDQLTLLTDNWPPDYRDTCTRMYQGKWIVFAGDVSWGDEPEGLGYTLLRDLSNSLVYEELGFE